MKEQRYDVDLLDQKCSFSQITSVKTKIFRAALRERPLGLHSQVGFGRIWHVQDGCFCLLAVSEVATAKQFPYVGEEVAT